ncbi:CBN-TAG-315 protein [Caenorhabditis brenneri]|uniref:CBN-TAG-315 protein n=1 Tax=Caenorhabditis brenneri TaxID=135651 RepID=G0N922_CAEBE|nr:CBN-TAG-315 protein [Caenorhabditis brenneri]
MNPNRPSTSEYQPEEEEYGNILENVDESMEVEYEEAYQQDEDDTDDTIVGVDIRPHLEALNNNVQVEADEEVDVAPVAGDEDLVHAINMFMRNEYDYDQFMRVTGGQTLREELGTKLKRPATEDPDDDVDEVDTAEDDDEDEDGNEEDEDIEGADDMSASQFMDGSFANALQAAASDDRYDALPEEARLILSQIMSGQGKSASTTLAANIADALKNQFDETVDDTAAPVKQIKLEIDDEEGGTSTSAPTQSASEATRDRGKSKRLDAMLGQANVLAARGNISDAMELLHEVIRQDRKHAIAYQQIAAVYEQEGHNQKALQFGLLASHLNPKTPADDWVHWGDEAKKFGMFEDAAVCYDRAIHLNNENWKYYEKRIEMLELLQLRPLAMRTRLQAAQLINNETLKVDFQWFHELIRKVAQYYITMNDEEKAIQSLEAFVLRSREFGEEADAQQETLVGMYLAKNKFQQAGMSILALCKGVKAVFLPSREPACSITYTNGTYECTPFPPRGNIGYELDYDLFPISMHCHLVICLFSMNEIDQSTELEKKLLERRYNMKDDENFLLDVPRFYKNRGNPRFAIKYLDELSRNSTYDHESSGAFWYLRGCLETMQKQEEAAMESFNKVLILEPSHVDNRIHLSTLQQKAGLFDKALETLEDYDLESCSALPDERLLARRADVLFESGKSTLFVQTTRMMLAPHFYKVYVAPELMKKRRVTKGKLTTPALSNTLKTCAFNVIKHTNWERLVKRLGATVEANGVSYSSLSGTDLHDYCLKLIECLNKDEKHLDALIVCCYAFLHPTLFKCDKTSTFQNLVYYCAIKARCWSLAFEYVRFYYTFALTAPTAPENAAHLDMLQKRLFNAMNYVFVNSQNVCYHRFIMRALVKNKDNHALQAISGNNSLITGTYRHAMGEYLRVWVNNKRNPLICLLLALTFTHMSCKKDLSSRHLIGIRGIAFMKKYSKVRTCQQEVFYNIARMFHQMSILPLAKHFYDKVLRAKPPNVFAFDEEGNEIVEPATKYDLRKMAAHNLALIYRTSGNILAARELYEKYLVV